jgi:hypothetical protein
VDSLNWILRAWNAELLFFRSCESTVMETIVDDVYKKRITKLRCSEGKVILRVE